MQDHYNPTPPFVPHSYWLYRIFPPSSQGNTSILTMIARFSKACRVIPHPKLGTGNSQTLMHQCVLVPDDIISDRGPQFTSSTWTGFLKNLNIYISLTLGPTAKLNASTKKLLVSFTPADNNQNDWSCNLIWAENTQNVLYKLDTGLTIISKVPAIPLNDQQFSLQFTCAAA